MRHFGHDLQDDVAAGGHVPQVAQLGGHDRGAAHAFTAMSDPDFLAERKQVRETLEALTERYRLINIEFDRRAAAAWAAAS